jgi:hypothetical protein
MEASGQRHSSASLFRLSFPDNPLNWRLIEPPSLAGFLVQRVISCPAGIGWIEVMLKISQTALSPPSPAFLNRGQSSD